MIIKASTLVPISPKIGLLPINYYSPTGANSLSAEIFHDNVFPTPKECIVFVSGGAGNASYPVTHSFPIAGTRKGRLWYNARTYGQLKLPSDRIRYGRQPIHNPYYWSIELQSHLEYLAANYPQLERVVIFGHSRGAGLVCSWSDLSRKLYNNVFPFAVRGIVPNSPAGGSDAQGQWLSVYYAQRATYTYFNRMAHRTIATVGAGDYTHTNRAHMENVNRFLDNPLVDLRIIGDNTYGHSWPSQHIAEWFDLAEELF